jgi:UDP-N-acetylmuramate dehydrogenase
VRQQAIPLAGFTTWKVGGVAEFLAEPNSLAELRHLLTNQKQLGAALQIIGAGSNLLISDSGLPGLVVCTRRLQGAQLDPSSGEVEALAGEPLPTLARRVAKSGLSGLEWSVGIPGTVGGAVVMNAGAQGGCLAEYLIDATVIDPTGGEPFVLSNRALNYGYRHSRLQGEGLIVLSARFQLLLGEDPCLINARTSENLQSRISTQPYHLPSCGSVFRNPEPQKAGRLIEALGLKGHRIGAAEVSELHGNFIVNRGGAKALEIDALIHHVQAEVKRAHGIWLHPEVMRLGEFPNVQQAAA